MQINGRDKKDVLAAIHAGLVPLDSNGNVRPKSDHISAITKEWEARNGRSPGSDAECGHCYRMAQAATMVDGMASYREIHFENPRTGKRRTGNASRQNRHGNR